MSNAELILKGGSLSKTFIKQSDGANPAVVRKQVSLEHDREYGYVRWYSQMKKMERLGTLIPYMFPKILGVGVSNNCAWYDMTYLHTYQTVRDSLTSKVLAGKINKSLWSRFDFLHSFSREYNLPGKTNSMKLYFIEEVMFKIKEAMSYPEFEQFFIDGPFKYGNEEVPGINHYLDRLNEYFSTAPNPPSNIIHGNPTLENIMYSRTDLNKIVFIDLYEESVIDTKFLDYAI